MLDFLWGVFCYHPLYLVVLFPHMKTHLLLVVVKHILCASTKFQTDYCQVLFVYDERMVSLRVKMVLEYALLF